MNTDTDTTTTTTAAIFIRSIVRGKDITDVVDIIRLSNGDAVPVWNGNACYGEHDTAEGLRVGAKLVGIELRESWRGEAYHHYIFD